MAQGKKSIIVYAEWIEIFNSLSDEEAGRLIKHFFCYVNDLNPTAPDRITEISFIPIKQSLKRDLTKWAETIDKRAQSGRLGGLKSAEARQSKTKQSEANEANASNLKQTQANEAVNVNVNDNVNVLTKVNIDIAKTTLEDCEKIFIEKTAFNWTTEFAKIEAAKFWNFYCSKNWMVGKNKMKSLPHAIGGWISRTEEREKANQKQKPKSRIQQMQELYHGAKY